MSSSGYQVRRVGRPWPRRLRGIKSASRWLRNRCRRFTTGPWQVRLDHGEWLTNHFADAHDAVAKMRHHVENGKVGSSAEIKGETGPHFAVRKTFRSRGNEAIKWLLDHLGDRYVWGADGPLTYDCSGLIEAMLSRFGVIVPHQSGLIFQDPDVKVIWRRPDARAFSGPEVGVNDPPHSIRERLRDSDLIGMHFGRLEGIDHIGAFYRDQMIDTRSSTEPVAVRDIEWGNVWALAYVPAITGQH